MGKVWMPGGGGGTDLDMVTAGKPDVLAGKVIVDKEGDPLIGAMPNNGSVSQALNAGGSYTVPAGYHNGSGKVTANSLASQTSATATAAQILSGQTAWVNGNKLTGTMAVQSILSFSAAAYSTTQILLQWQTPYAATGKPFSGVFINYSTSGYPGTGGTRIYTGYGNNATPGGWSSVIVNMPAIGTTYYFSATAYASASPSDIWGNTLNAVATTTAKGQQVFTYSGTFTVPTGVRSIDVFIVGGGGGGSYGGTSASSSTGGSGGGGGYTNTIRAISVTPGQTFNVVVGSGGAGGTSPASGGNTSFGTYNVAGGANGGTRAGGSGGGSGTSKAWSSPAGAGGSDGGNGGLAHFIGGTGQGFTTRSFGESGGTLYSGGGGGGGEGYNPGTSRGLGGAGGGGNGSDRYNGGSAGAANTGGGGGGGYYGDGGGSGFNGGAGICIVRWGY